MTGAMRIESDRKGGAELVGGADAHAHSAVRSAQSLPPDFESVQESQDV